MNLQDAISILGREGKKINLISGKFEYAECTEGLEFCFFLPEDDYLGNCFYKVRANGKFEFAPWPGFEKPYEEEGWSVFKTIDIDFESDPPTWRIIDTE